MIILQCIDCNTIEATNDFTLGPYKCVRCDGKLRIVTTFPNPTEPGTTRDELDCCKQRIFFLEKERVSLTMQVKELQCDLLQAKNNYSALNNAFAEKDEKVQEDAKVIEGLQIIDAERKVRLNKSDLEIERLKKERDELKQTLVKVRLEVTSFDGYRQEWSFLKPGKCPDCGGELDHWSNFACEHWCCYKCHPGMREGDGDRC